jgi:hypothetical protein
LSEELKRLGERSDAHLIIAGYVSQPALKERILHLSAGAANIYGATRQTMVAIREQDGAPARVTPRDAPLSSPQVTFLQIAAQLPR